MSILQTGIIDVDVHPWINGDIRGLLPYLSTSMQKRFEDRLTLPNHALRPPLARASSNRIDAIPPSGGEPGSDPLYMSKDLMDRHNIKHSILSSIQAGKLVAIPNPAEATALASAFNDFFMQQWLTVDSRYKLSACIAVHDPQAAAKEIRRVAQNPAVVAIFMPLINILMGNRYYYPIYEAVQECGLPIYLHPTGTEGGFSTSLQFAGGPPTSYIERHTNFPQIAMAQLSSLTFEGVFQAFPKLKIVLAEFGYSWLPHIIWRMDQNWRQFRREVPWIKEEPSRLIFDHLRLTSQPIEEPSKNQYNLQIFEMIQAEKTLMFSTDYPHWDNDFPDTTFTSLPDLLKQRIFHDTAAEWYGLE
jgi:predicted TIM-barrel fold metal-dependent hydrolase